MDDTRLGMDTEQPDKNEALEASEEHNKEKLAKGFIENGSSIQASPQALNISGPALPQSGYYKAGHGEYRTTGIQSVGTVVSTPRP